jgi:NAD(P)-dependent dehydrogenase (short-subunit alcohol dehydrogenase family)
MSPTPEKPAALKDTTDMKLRGKKAIVTGAAAGIGHAIATRFCSEGATVACLDIDAPRLDETVRGLNAAGARALAFPVDLGVPAEAERAARDAIAALGGLDILVNNAGVNASGTLETTELADWNRTLAVDLTSVFVLSKAAWPVLAAQRRGVILNMSSIMGLTGAANSFAYCACKAAIVGLTRSLAADGGPLGIRVNCVSPGFVSTPIMDRAHSPEFQQRISEQLPARRMASAPEIAAGFVFLASDDASYVTGATLVMDGAATVGFAGCYLEE